MKARRILILSFVITLFSSLSLALEVKLNADKVLYYPQRDIMEAIGNVTLLWGNLKAVSEKGWFNIKTRDAFLEGNVIVEDERGTLRAAKVSFDAKSETYLAEGNVVLVTKENAKLECGKLEAKGKDRYRAYEKPMISMKKAVLRAEEMIYEGGEMKIASPKYEDGEKGVFITASKAKVFFSKDGKIKSITCSENVLIKHVKDKSTFQAKGNEGTYDVDEGVIRVSGKVSATKDKTEIRADEVIYNVNTGVMRAVGETKMIIH